MEFIFSIGKGTFIVLLWALIQSPFLLWSAKLAKTANISLQAAFTLGIIAGIATFPVDLVYYLLSGILGEHILDGLSLVTVLSITVWLYGYFLRSESGTSIGMRRGFIVLSLEFLMLLGVLIAGGLLFSLVLAILR